MRRLINTLLLMTCLCTAEVVRAAESVPAAQSVQFPKINASLDDGFYVLAELLAADVLDNNPSKKETSEASLLMAHALWGQQRYEEILTLLEEQDNAPGAVYWKARALFELKRYDSALRLLQNNETVFTESRFAPSALRLKGHVEAFLGLLDAAAETFLLFKTTYPADPEITENDFDLAKIYQRQKKYVAAIDVYKEVTGVDDKNSAERAQLKLGHLLYSQSATNNFAEARNLLVNLATNDQAQLIYRIDAWVDLAALEDKAEQQEAALSSLQQAILLSPDARQRVPLKLTMAKMMLQHGDGEGALKLLEECRAEAPNEVIAAELQLEKAGALYSASRFADAEEAYQVYLDVSSDEAGLASAWFGKGLCLWELERFTEAATAFDKAAQSYTDSPERAAALFKAGDSYYQAKQFNEASQHYSSFVGEFPSRPELPNVLYQLGLALDNYGSKAEALKTFQLLEAQFTGTKFAEQAAIQVAQLLRRDNKQQAALDKFIEIAQTYTNEAVVSLSRHQSGFVLWDMGKYDAALRSFESVVSDFPQSEYAPQASYMRGFCMDRMGQFDEAHKICAEFINAYPTSIWAPEVLFWLAEKQYNQGKYAAAEKLFVQIVTEYKTHAYAPRALYWAGQAAQAQDNYVKAIERYSSLTIEYPNSGILPQTRFAQGDALSLLGEHARAILAFEEIIKNYPENYLVNAAWGRKGDCQFSLAMADPKRFGEAIKCFQAILDRPSTPLVLRLHAEYKLGKCLEKTGVLDKAFNRYMHTVLTYLDENSEYSPDTVMWFTRAAFDAAAIKEKEREWQEAVKIYEHVIDANVPAREEAQNRIENIKKENWLLFQQL